MNNNIMGMIIDAVRNYQTPREAIAAMVRQNPQARMALQMMNGKTDTELEQIVRNMARERGVALEDVARSIGLQIPSGR